MAEKFTQIDYPAVRQFTEDIGKLANEKHYIRTFLEVDITDSLALIKQLRTPQNKVSFLAWFIKVLGDTVADHPPVNGIKKGRNSVIVFKQIDITTIVEKPVDGVPVPLPLVIRSASEKTTSQINLEIQNAVSQQVENDSIPEIGTSDNKFLISLGQVLPQWLRLFVMRNFVLNNPQRMQNTMGTVMVTSLGTVGQIPSWIMPTSIHPLSIGIGTLTRKPIVKQGQIIPRQVLHITIALDHDVIDGMPARAFVADFVTRLSQGYGL